MSSRDRRLPEDSVLASISQVQELLRQERRGRGPTAPHRELPVPQPVPEEVVGGVPSMAEVEASREARWQADPPSPVPVAPLVGRRRRLRAALALVGAAALAGAVGWGLGRSATSDGARQAVEAAEARARALTERAARAERALEEARAELARLRAQNARLLTAAEARVPASEPTKSAARPTGSTRTTKARGEQRTRRSRSKARAARRAPARGSKRRVRRGARRLTNTDKRLSSLIEDL